MCYDRPYPQDDTSWKSQDDKIISFVFGLIFAVAELPVHGGAPMSWYLKLTATLGSESTKTCFVLMVNSESCMQTLIL